MCLTQPLQLHFLTTTQNLIEGITFIINPYDEFCLTKAVFIKESLGATITAINVGDNNNDAILRKALAIGADKLYELIKNLQIVKWSLIA